MESEFKQITQSSNIRNNFDDDNSLDCNKEEINKNYDIKHSIKSECQVILKRLNIKVKTENCEEVYLPDENVHLKLIKNKFFTPEKIFKRNEMKIQINKDEQSEEHDICHHRKRAKHNIYKSNRKRSFFSIKKINKIRGNIKKKYMKIMCASRPKESFTCNLCTRIFTNQKVLRTHLFFHIGNKRFHCTTCHRMFLWIFLLRSHMKEHAYEQHIEVDNRIVRVKSSSKYLLNPLIQWKPFHCDICDKSVLTISRLKMRDKTHLSHICKVCKKEFKWESQLKIHLVTHSEARPFKCNVCKKGFKSNQALKSHYEIHNDEYKYSCPICNRSFRSRASLASHKILHNDKNNHFCKICKTSFKTRGTLKSHVEVHNVEYKYSCSICNKRFKTKNCLSAHKSTHKRK